MTLRLDGDWEWLGTGLCAPRDVRLRDGFVEAELAVPAARSFHGVFWRAHGPHYESFFVRPHQSGNPDAVQYTPAFNGVSSWQLYHGDGFWAPVEIPVGTWFTIRVDFADDVASISLDGERILTSRLRIPAAAGRVGVFVGGEGLRVKAFHSGAGAELAGAEPPPERVEPAAVRTWEISQPFHEDDDVPSQLRWTTVTAEPSGLLDIARVHPVDADGATVLARTHLRAEKAQTVPLDLGFSDRVAVSLNGEPLFRGDATYRSRDYRFLGSIGWFDTIYLPLRAGDNELVVAVSEDFGGWGLQARYSPDWSPGWTTPAS
jgi:hypothetical protein